MSLSLYDISVPVMIGGLNNLGGVLRRGANYATETGLAEEALVTKKLWPDMMPLSAQIQRASDTARFAAVRVAQARNVAMADDEKSIEALQQRLAATIAFLEAVDPQGYEGREMAEVLLPVRGETRTYTAESYLLDYALPNFWFHITTAYDLLRAAGVPIGKRHFLGWE
jgi:hypothetical protein